jgi:hypothetical protein
VAVSIRSIIAAARDQHPAFDKQRTPDAVLLRFLTSEHKALVTKARARNWRAVAATVNVPLPLADFAAGFTLPANVYVGEGTAHSTADTGSIPAPFTIVDPSLRFADVPMPAGYVENGTLFLVGQASDWTIVASVDVRYVPASPTFANDAQNITLPDEASPALESAAALFMALRGHTDKNLPPMNVSAFAEMASRAESTFLDGIGNQRVGHVFQIRDIF